MSSEDIGNLNPKDTGNVDEDFGSSKTSVEPQVKEKILSESKPNKFLQNCQPEPSIQDKISKRMFCYAKESICFSLVLAFTALAALHSLPPRVSKPPAAKPFFNESSLVLDFYKGHLGALVDRVTDSDFSFVMYYAPWDAECQMVKKEFEIVAQYYESQIFFAAINCWHPGSECRSRYNKIQSYPVLMMYPSRESGVQYKGIRSAPYIIRFINSFINPIKRLTSYEQIMELLTFYDAVVIGYFNFNGLQKSPGYREFYRTALKSLEKDPNGEIVFCAVTSSVEAYNYSIFQTPSASLTMWNETLYFPRNQEWNSDNLLNWMNNAIHRVSTWLQPPGIKSLTFAPYLWDGPVLFLFTPRNPLHLENHNYNLVKEVALKYYDCAGNYQVDEIERRLEFKRQRAVSEIFEKQMECLDIFESDDELQPLVHNDCIKNQSSGVPCCRDVPTNKCVPCPNRNDLFHGICLIPQHDSEKTCRNFNMLDFFLNFEDPMKYLIPPEFEYKNLDIIDESCPVVQKNKPDSLNIDFSSPELVKKWFSKENCRQFLSGYTYQKPIFPRRENDTEKISLTKEICKVNKTLAFVAIDSLYYFHFAESLGIDIFDAPNKTIAVIVDSQDESQYVMSEDLGKDSLIRFINNYTHGLLKRTLRSVDPKRFVRSVDRQKYTKSNRSSIWVEELTSGTFLDKVVNSKKDVVIMYHSPYCAFCSAVSYVYLTVAHYLMKMERLEFVRIDGDNNDLPWEYTMNRYPTILFFPARSKEDSTVFPSNLPMSVGNLLNFVLANLDEESHLEALINVCASGAGGSPGDCVRRIQWFCLDTIEEHLKEFRKLRRKSFIHRRPFSQNVRRLILLKLEHVRRVHLTISVTEDLSRETDKLKSLRKMYRKFYRTVDNFKKVQLGRSVAGSGSKLKSNESSVNNDSDNNS